MKADILSLENEKVGEIKLPKQFEEPIRPDLIKRSVLVIQSNNRQPYGADPEAGKRASVRLSKKRHDYRGSYGHGISRTPRKIMSRRGTRMNWTGAFAPNTVGGRRAHPPKAEKIWGRKINIKERRKAIRSALASAVSKEIVVERGHKVPDNYPLILEDKFEKINKTKEVMAVLEKIGLKDELKRCSVKKVRAGRGTMRGRKYKKKIGPLIVVSDKCALEKAALNIPGADIVEIKNINACLLAPGTHPGRITIFTKSAVEKLEKEKLFM
jgi:large subunit ribosomal protein L4e